MFQVNQFSHECVESIQSILCFQFSNWRDPLPLDCARLSSLPCQGLDVPEQCNHYMRLHFRVQTTFPLPSESSQIQAVSCRYVAAPDLWLYQAPTDHGDSLNIMDNAHIMSKSIHYQVFLMDQKFEYCALHYQIKIKHSCIFLAQQ